MNAFQRRVERDGMPGQVIHVGMDYWQRTLVLNRSGFRPKLCADPESLSTVLTGTGTVDAVVISESPELDVSQVTDLVRSVASCPVILFPLEHDEYDEGKYDLVVQSLTPPDKWVQAIGATIRRFQETCQRSQLLGRESAEAREASRLQRERSETLIESGRKLPGNICPE